MGGWDEYTYRKQTAEWVDQIWASMGAEAEVKQMNAREQEMQGRK
jgi:hypothetical protein